MIGVVESVILVGLAYFNLITFGGIDFPNESFGIAYWRFWWLAVYGGAILVFVAALLLVKKRNIGYPLLLGLLSLPLVAQGIAFFLYFKLGERYGYVCC